MPIISKAGDIVTLKCTVTAVPMPTATWLILRNMHIFCKKKKRNISL